MTRRNQNHSYLVLEVILGQKTKPGYTRTKQVSGNCPIRNPCFFLLLAFFLFLIYLCIIYLVKGKRLGAVRKQIHRKGNLPKGTDVFLILKKYKAKACLSKLEICTDYHPQWVMGAWGFLVHLIYFEV